MEKKEKNFYLPKNKPELIDIPAFNFFHIKGQGNPNDKFFGEYISVLYALSYSVKMSPKKGMAPKNYYDYTVYPLEGIWDINDDAKKNYAGKIDKKDLVFDLMIRQPDFVNQDFASQIIEFVKINKANDLINHVEFGPLEDGKCIQMLHLGSYDEEYVSFQKMDAYCNQLKLERISKKHREIYLSDARKTKPEKLKTVLRYQV